MLLVTSVPTKEKWGMSVVLVDVFGHLVACRKGGCCMSTVIVDVLSHTDVLRHLTA